MCLVNRLEPQIQSIIYYINITLVCRLTGGIQRASHTSSKDVLEAGDLDFLFQ